MKQLLLVLFFFVLTSTLLAQTAREDTMQYRYPAEIIIKGSRLPSPEKELPFTVSVVDTNTMKHLARSVAIDEPLKLVPGMKIDNQANGSRIHMSIRGQGILTERGIRGIKVLYDELPINDPTGFAPDFFDIDYNTVDRIEVLRGPAASLYGGSASGGIINITSRNSPNSPLVGEASATAGSNNFWKGFGQFGGNVDDVNYRLSFSRMIGDGYRQHTAFWGDNVYAKAIYTPLDNLQLTPIFGYTNVYHQNAEGISLALFNQDPKIPNDAAIPFNEFLQTERLTSGITGLYQIDKQNEIKFNGFEKHTIFTEANNHYFDHRTMETPGTSIQYNFKIGEPDDHLKNVLSAGTDLEWQTMDEHRDTNYMPLEGDTLLSKVQMKQRGVGVFLFDKINVGKDWTFHANLRYDDTYLEVKDYLSPIDGGNEEFNKTTGRLGATYSPMPEANLFANWGQGFMPPTTEEVVNNPDAEGGFNSHLSSATSNGFEVGSRGTIENSFDYDITGFYLNTKNDFDRYRIPGRGQTTFYRNAASSDRYGIELYGKYTPVKDFDIQLAYTYSHFKYTNADTLRIMMDDPTVIKYIENGNFLPNCPEHEFYLDLQYIVAPKLTVGLSMEAQSKVYIDGANIEAEAAPGYALFHARAEYELNLGVVRSLISLSAKNIFDKHWVAFTEPDPGGNSYQPGSGQEFFGGLKIMF